MNSYNIIKNSININKIWNWYKKTETNNNFQNIFKNNKNWKIILSGLCFLNNKFNLKEEDNDKQKEKIILFLKEIEKENNNHSVFKKIKQFIDTNFVITELKNIFKYNDEIQCIYNIKEKIRKIFITDPCFYSEEKISNINDSLNDEKYFSSWSKIVSSKNFKKKTFKNKKLKRKRYRKNKEQQILLEKYYEDKKCLWKKPFIMKISKEIDLPHKIIYKWNWDKFNNKFKTSLL